jgi:hypothetical protein
MYSLTRLHFDLKITKPVASPKAIASSWATIPPVKCPFVTWDDLTSLFGSVNFWSEWDWEYARDHAEEWQ